MAFKSVKTNLIRSTDCINWYKTWYYGSGKELYYGITGGSAWSDDTDPDIPTASTTTITGLDGIIKATCQFVDQNDGDTGSIIYSDGTYWDEIIPTDPATDDYTNILSNNINHLYISCTVNYDDIVNTIRTLSIHYNPLDLLAAVCTNNIYEDTEISSQGSILMIGNSSVITIESGQTLQLGNIIEF